MRAARFPSGIFTSGAGGPGVAERAITRRKSVSFPAAAALISGAAAGVLSFARLRSTARAEVGIIGNFGCAFTTGVERIFSGPGVLFCICHIRGVKIVDRALLHFRRRFRGRQHRPFWLRCGPLHNIGKLRHDFRRCWRSVGFNQCLPRMRGAHRRGENCLPRVISVGSFRSFSFRRRIFR